MAFIPHPERRPVLVSGASSGIGAATAEWLAAAGYPVALTARRVEKLQELADKITAAGDSVLGMAQSMNLISDHALESARVARHARRGNPRPGAGERGRGSTR